MGNKEGPTRSASERERDLQLQERRRRTRERLKKAGKRTGEIIVLLATPTRRRNPRKKVLAIEGKFSQKTADTLTTSANVLEGVGVALVGIGAGVLSPAIAATGAGMYAVGRVPGILGEKWTNFRLRREELRKRNPPKRKK